MTPPPPFPLRLRAAAVALGMLAPIAAGELALRLIPFSYDGRGRMPVNEEQPSSVTGL